MQQTQIETEIDLAVRQWLHDKAHPVNVAVYNLLESLQKHDIPAEVRDAAYEVNYEVLVYTGRIRRREEVA